jgi:PAS domain-containing protein
VRIGSVSAADQLARLRALVPSETARCRDTQVRERFRTLAWAAGVTLPTQVELIRPDGSRLTVTIEGVGDDQRQTERMAATGVSANTRADPKRDLISKMIQPHAPDAQGKERPEKV